MRRWRSVRRIAAAAVTVLLVASFAWLGLTADALLGFRLRASDRFHPSGPTDERLLVVEIDAETLRETGPTLPRTALADLVSAIAAGRPAAIALDLVLDTPSDDDERLVASIADAGVVVLAAGSTIAPRGPAELFEVLDPGLPLPRFADAAAAVAHPAVFADRADGTVRAVPMVVENERRFEPSLSLAAVAIAEGADPDLLTLRPQGVQVGDRYVATDDARVMGVNFSAPLIDVAADRPGVSARDVIAGRVEATRFEGAIVFVGVTDPLARDLVSTPVARTRPMPGVYVHANAANTALTGLTRSLPTDASTLMLVLALAAVAAAAGAFLRLQWLPLVVIAALVGHLVLVDVAWQRGQEYDLVYPWVGAVVTAVIMVAYRYVTEVRARRQVAGLFAEYVPSTVVDQLLDTGRVRAAAEGERLEVTVLFCDLRGFTATAAALEPSQVRHLLERYYERAAEAIFDQGGTVMQYVGDEVFAVFGAPVRQPDHTTRALAAARALRATLATINAELARADTPPIAFGIGLNCGEVVAAHVGNRYRRQYAVVGDTVNVGARLCSVARAGEIVLSGAVADAAGVPEDAEEVGPLTLKGVDRDPRALRLPAAADPASDETAT